jgi:hypothetical protein
MSSDAILLSKIFEITRGDLETAIFPFLQLGPIVDRLTFTRITRLSRFWEQSDSKDGMLLEQSTEDLIAGLYGQSCPWMLILKGTAKEIGCWFGLNLGQGETSASRLVLAGAFPDIRCSDVLSLSRTDLNRLRHALVLTGTPSIKADQIEKVCRGLYGSEWVYAIYAEPIQSVAILKTLNDVSEQIRNVHATYLLKASAIDENNRIAQRYIELLETKLKRLEQGRTSGMWNARVMLLTDNASLLGRAQGLLHSAFSGEKSVPDPIRARPCSGDVRQSPHLEPLTTSELAILARPSREEHPGYEVVDYARFGVENNYYNQNSKPIRVGDIFDRGVSTGNTLQLPRKDLTKHGLIVGVTGSGKTNTCFMLLDQIWDGGKGVPFLVIESAKSEYRGLLRNPRFKGLKLFTIGDETTSPLRLNPFEVPRGILLQTHLDYLKSLFSAAFVLYPPMPYVLEQSIQEIYEDRGWDLARNTNWRGKDSERLYPTLTDLAAKIEVVINRMGYDERITMDVKAGLLARIEQLRLGGGKGLMLNTRQSIDSSVLFEQPCILELKQIVSDDEKAFLIGLILIRLYEHYEAGATQAKGDLCHITLIEEAHRLLRNVSMEQGGEVAANPRGRAIEVFANILSEIRAYGEGILMAEQIPVKLTPDAIKNTNLKIIHRLVAEDDRRIVGTTINLSDTQTRYLTKLRAGEAVAYTEGMQKPVLLTIPLSQMKSSDAEVSNMEIKSTMRPFWQQNQNLMLPFPGCTKCPATVAGRSCGAREGSKSDGLLKSAFKRLFNALRLNSDFVFDAYLDFEILLRRNPAWRQGATTSYCLFVELLESEVERRSEFWGWPYSDVEEAIFLTYSVMSNLTNKHGKVEKEVLEKEIKQDLTALSNLFDLLHKVEMLPYDGCRSCLSPCNYRFDMKHSSNASNAREFRSIFLNPGRPMDEVVHSCWKATANAIHTRDIETRRGAAICFAVQQFSEMGLSSSNQADMARKVTDSIEVYDGNNNRLGLEKS